MDVTRERPQGLVCLEEDPSGPADGLTDRVRGEGDGAAPSFLVGRAQRYFLR